MPNKVTVNGHKELIENLRKVSTRVGTALSAAIRDGLTPVVPIMRQQVLQMVTGGEEFSNHWTTSETDFREYTTRSGKKKRTLSSGELIRAVKANSKYAGKAKVRRKFEADGSLAVVGKTGMLAKSISVKVKAKRAQKVSKSGRVSWKSQGASHGWLGPSNIEQVAVNPWTGKPQLVVPTRYAHLVNNGHVLKIRGKVVGRVKRRDFLNPVYQAQAAGIENRIAHRIKLEIAAATNAIKKKGR